MIARLVGFACIALLFGCSSDADPADNDKPTAWHAVAAEHDAGALYAVYASGPDDVWLAGGEGSKPLVWRFDGTAWTRNDPPVKAKLRWVTGDGSGRILVAGDGGQGALWDGKAWSDLSTGHSGAVLWGAWLDKDGPWVVGGATAGKAGADDVLLMLRHDGKAWAKVGLDARATWPKSADARLFKMWRDGSTGERFVVGGRGIALRGDGTSWTHATAAAGGGPLFTVHGRSAKDVWAIGGVVEVALVHFDGNGWNQVDLTDGAPSIAQGVFVRDDGVVQVGGGGGYTARRLPDGKWLESVIDTSADLHAVAYDGKRWWAVGGDIAADLDDHTGAVFCDDPKVPSL